MNNTTGENLTDKVKAIVVAIVAVISVAVVIIFINYFVTKNKPIPNNNISAQPSEFPDWDAIKGENPDVKIFYASVTSSCPVKGCVNENPATVNMGSILKKYIVKGKFSRVYLYVEAMVDYDRPLTVWDDFYFRINGFGGHIISDTNSLPVPPSEISRFLYDFRSISYFPSIQDKEKNLNKQININLFALLQDGITLDIISAISSDRPGGVMKEVSIYYECFQGSECVIEENK